jgi:two-component system cell cycle response regulator CtrA
VRILIIEDETLTAQSLAMTLKQRDVVVDSVDLGEDGVEFARSREYDLILLDLTLPDMSGLDVLRSLRLSRVDTPVLILSGTGDSETKLKSFDRGADDYVTKPYQRDELVARIRAIDRRAKGHAQATVAVGGLSINMSDRTVRANGVRLHVTGSEYRILEMLFLRKGAVLSKETMMNNLYNGMDAPEMKVIDVFLCKLRKKLADATGGAQYIETVWGQGYTLRAPEASALAA